MRLPLLLALFFAPLAGAIAFVIAYAEYSKHLFDKSRSGEELEAGLLAFVFFLVVPPPLIWPLLIR
jgi:hypothetical protein